MVYDTYNYSIHGVYKPTNITGGASPMYEILWNLEQPWVDLARQPGWKKPSTKGWPLDPYHDFSCWLKYAEKLLLVHIVQEMHRHVPRDSTWATQIEAISEAISWLDMHFFAWIKTMSCLPTPKIGRINIPRYQIKSILLIYIHIYVYVYIIIYIYYYIWIYGIRKPPKMTQTLDGQSSISAHV
jgi:hypothetical protein